MQNKKVSIVMPNYNRAEYVVRCVKSVLNSDYENIEVIVVDNASSDNSVSSLKTSINDNRLKIVELTENLMVADGRNAGFKFSSGEYLCYLDNDNEVDKIRIQRCNS